MIFSDEDCKKGAWVVLPDGFHKDYTSKLHSGIKPIGGVKHETDFSKERRLFWKQEALDIQDKLKKTAKAESRNIP